MELFREDIILFHYMSVLLVDKPNINAQWKRDANILGVHVYYSVQFLGRNYSVKNDSFIVGFRKIVL